MVPLVATIVQNRGELGRCSREMADFASIIARARVTVFNATFNNISAIS
jgi:hypothetical protein